MTQEQKTSYIKTVEVMSFSPDQKYDPAQDIERFIQVLPERLQRSLTSQEQADRRLVEVIIDLGRVSYARYERGEELPLGRKEVSQKEMNSVLANLSEFGGDNRAGINRTLHRISVIRNRKGEPVGLTCRVGRSVGGAADIIRDLIRDEKSVLLLGRPGVGKTTILREAARILADVEKKRVVIVDTSNEIGGDGDIPHPAIGRARRMQVPRPEEQHQLMIEAVENHMPEVIVIDEMGTVLEAQAARTIAERGVQLIATAHGYSLENLLINPTLNDLLGGIQTVTLGDEEARRRGTQKSILERKAPPTFDVLVEIEHRGEMRVHLDLQQAVDAQLRGTSHEMELRTQLPDGQIQVERIQPHSIELSTIESIRSTDSQSPLKIFPFGLSRVHVRSAAQQLGYPITTVSKVQDAEVIIINKKNYRKRGKRLRSAEDKGIPLYLVTDNSLEQAVGCLSSVFEIDRKNG